MPAGVTVPLALIAGVAAGVVWPVRSLDAVALGLALASLALLSRPGPLRRALLAGCLVAGAAADGAAARGRALSVPLADWLAIEAPRGRLDEPVALSGTLAEDAGVSDVGVRLVIDVERVELSGRSLDLRGRVQATVAGESSASQQTAWRAGRRVRAPVLLRTLDVWRNPGSPSETWQRLRRPFDAAGSIKSGALVLVARGPWWREAEASVRAHVRDASERFIRPRNAQSAAIVTAILIGDRAGLDPAVQRRLQAAGTYHVIAISGGNVALVTALCFVAVRLVARSARAPAVVTILAVLAYGAILSDDPSIRRAVAGATLYFTLSLAGLVPRAVNLLAVVAMAIAVVDPLVVIDVGAWLSFGATLGIVVWAGRIARVLRAGVPPAGAPRARAAVAYLWSAAAGLFAATISAEIALLPISAGVFSRVSVAGLALNFVAIPAMSVVQIAGFVMAALAGWWPWAAAQAGTVGDEAARALVSSTGLLDVLPWLSWRVPPVSLGWTAVYYAACACAGWPGAIRRGRVLAGGAALVAAVVIGTAPAVSVNQPIDGRLRFTMLDVGQGDALVVQFPTGQSLIVDEGGIGGGFDIGARVVTPALWALGVRRLDWLAFTHPDLDHIGGAASVTDDLHPREIWEGVPVPRNLARAHLSAVARGIAWRQLQAGDRLQLGHVVIDVLHPPRPDWERQRTRNEDSLVMQLRFDDVSLMLTGDVGAEFESRFEREPDAAPLAVLKVAHHGSRSSTAARFVDALRPQVALVSAGRGNLFGHPAPEVVARLAALGALVFRTDLDGAITVETDGHVLDIRTWSGKRWMLESQEVSRSASERVSGR
ncbi:MAG: ComEC/Rec2 family competence protein [Vicinamibacterales bacterium]